MTSTLDDGRPPWWPGSLIGRYNEAALNQGSQTLRHSHRIIPGQPVQVGHGRQLLMDWHVVDDLNGCERTVHQPVKHPDNPILTEPDGNGIVHGNVLREESGLYRLWTDTFDSERLEQFGKNARGTRIGAYYESDDGVSWRRPSLGLYEHYGDRDNNVFSEYSGGCVLALPERMQHRGRYARLYPQNIPEEDLPDPENMHGMTLRIAFSDDGIDWTDQRETPDFYGRSDTFNNIVHNSERDVFMQYRRATISAGEIRRIAYTESEDLLSWTQPLTVMSRDELDPMYLYGMTVSRYGGVYLGLLECLHSSPSPDRPLPSGKDHKMDIQLAWSRDGISWDRHPRRPTFIPNLPPYKGAYDWGIIRGARSIIEVGDDVYIYYTGRPYLHKPGVATSNGPITLCLATVKRDRFVSVDASADGGHMLTKPLAYPGGNLHINARTAPGGMIRVAVREGEGVRDGEWPVEFRLDKSVPFSGDTVDQVVTWEGSATIGSFPSSTLRLHFWLENAELYSFWFE